MKTTQASCLERKGNHHSCTKVGSTTSIVPKLRNLHLGKKQFAHGKKVICIWGGGDDHATNLHFEKK